MSSCRVSEQECLTTDSPMPGVIDGKRLLNMRTDLQRPSRSIVQTKYRTVSIVV